MNNPMTRIRKQVVDFLSWELLGPDSPNEQLDLSDPPTMRYSTGILFPGGHLIDENEESGEDAETDEEGTGSDEDGGDGKTSESSTTNSTGGGAVESADVLLDTPVQLANAQYPSALGLSFVCRSGALLNVRAQGGTYSKFKSESATVWKRKSLCRNDNPDEPLEYQFSAETKGKSTISATHEFAPGLSMHYVVSKREDDLCLVTVALWNSIQGSIDKRPNPAECFYQVGFRVSSVEDTEAIREYRLGTTTTLDEEEEELRLLYRERMAYATGHGCAANWPEPNEVEDGGSEWVETATLPKTEVRPLSARATDGELFSMVFLSGDKEKHSTEEIVKALGGLPDSYESWIDEQQNIAESIDPEFHAAAKRNLTRCADCLKRIRAGINLLSKDEEVMQAFKLANEAMYLQQQGPKYRLAWSDLDSPDPDPDKKRGQWRVFQLAFVLMNLRSIADSESDERDIVDLIWFPTGGGKTEAYLGLAAFTVFLRKLRKPDEHGTAVLMRYTLRLLTAQQFERAAALIAAMEYIRQRRQGKLGGETITIGLWAGDGLTPNLRTSAVDRLKQWMKDQNQPNPFQLLSCPWCGARLDDRSAPGYRRVGVGLATTVKFVCPEDACRYSLRGGAKEGIPAKVIDEDIYSSPPTLLIGTVDKFALLAWNPDAGILLTGDSDSCDPPDLIIQDELHLISGPLGTMVGLYEAVIDLLTSRNGKSPKIVASTATIRRAHEQCANLYDRSTNIFPPTGLSIKDSWFAVEQSEKTGRLYVGVFGSAAPSYVTSSLRSVASLLQASKSADTLGLGDAAKDPYWTVVWYFNSLRELGRAGTLVDADIPEYLNSIASRKGLASEDRRRIAGSIELTSRRKGDEIAKLLKRLNVEHPEKNALDTLLSTNMISVGIDIPRLGLMAVGGQPKTTSEYIQATSRVGREPDKAPGLVVTLYVPGKSRDRSHYEHFRDYHESFYRYVEPTSVTPYSIPAIERALHALIVIVARQQERLSKPTDLHGAEEWIDDLRDWLVKRAKGAGTEALYIDAMKERFDLVLDLWLSRAKPEWGKPSLKEDEGNHLLYPPSAIEELQKGVGRPVFDVPFATPTSMRNVDVECRLKITPTYAQGVQIEDEDGKGI